MAKRAAAVTVLAVASLLLLKKVENRLRRDNYVSIKVWSDDVDGQMTRVEKLITDRRMQVLNVSIEKDVHQKVIYLEFEVRSTTREVASDLIEGIAATGGVKKVGLE